MTHQRLLLQGLYDRLESGSYQRTYLEYKKDLYCRKENAKTTYKEIRKPKQKIITVFHTATSATYWLAQRLYIETLINDHQATESLTFATGLQKLKASFSAFSVVIHKWCAVMVALTWNIH